jgi:two-component sensor histidine kinase
MIKLSVLAVKQFFTVLILGALLTAVSVPLEFSARYRRGLETLDETFDSIERSYLPPLTLSVFNFNMRQTHLLAQGITLLPSIAYVEVRERIGDGSVTIVAVGERVGDPSLDRSYSLIQRRDGEPQEIGMLTVQADLERIRGEIAESLPPIVALNAAQIFAVAFLVFLIVQLSIVRHLKRTARFVQRIDPEQVDGGPLSLEHFARGLHITDEIDEIVYSINTMNARLKDAFAQKETLLRELYHRTKNNMQVIASMLSVHAAEVPENEEIQRLVTDTQNRIYAMSLVHEKLYQSNDLSRIDMRSYLSQLAVHISASYFTPAGPRLDLRLEPRNVLLDVAIPCGLIVNELVSNAMKHAFPASRGDDGGGAITVSFEVRGDDTATLSVSDNGVGLPEGFDPRADGRMGLQSVVALAEHQLSGQIDFLANHGLTTVVEFSVGQYSERV